MKTPNYTRPSRRLRSKVFHALAALCLGLTASTRAATLTVTNANDSGAGSLRQVISNSISGDTITFSNTLSGATILLTSGQLTIDKNLTLDASTLPGGISVSGNNATRVFQTTGGTTVTLNRLTITQGNAAFGGGIDNAGTLFLSNVSLLNNSTSGRGGAINNGGVLILNNSTVAGNTAADVGGGIVNNSGSLAITNSTLAGNTSLGSGGLQGFGGAIFNFAVPLTLVHCTLSGNTATTLGGGIRSQGGTVTLQNTIIASNICSGTGPDIANSGGTFITSGANLIGNNVTVTTEFPAGPLVGTAASPLNPLLAPLANYGGPTPTMPPLSGSPVIDAAATTSLTTDQRGFPRVVDGDANGSAVADIGATELAVVRDTFGYSPSLPAFAFEDISVTGTRVLANADDENVSAPLNFNFTFYGRSYSNASFTPNGLITLGGTNTSASNINLTNTAPSGNFPSIAVLWDDWVTRTNSNPSADAIYYQTLGVPGDHRLIVQWNNIFGFSTSPSSVTFQAVLFETNGNILCQYLDVDSGNVRSNGAQATVGIRDSDGHLNGKNLQWSFNQAVITNSEAIRFSTIGTDPRITTQPQSRTILGGTTATFTVTATGSSALGYQWQKNGVNLSDGGNVSGATTPTLTLTNVAASDAARYTAAVTNANGKVVSAVATLTFISPPAISTQPQSQTNVVGASVTFSVIATGGGLSYQWQTNSVNIPGAASASYTAVNVQTNDTGTSFTVIITNLVGSVTSSPPAILTVTNAVAPAIVTQPQSQTNGVGANVAFSVTASGTNPKSYQWRSNSINIPGATSASHTAFIDFRISNATIWRQPEQNCLYETSRIAWDVGRASSQDHRFPEAKAFSA